MNGRPEVHRLLIPGIVAAVALVLLLVGIAGTGSVSPAPLPGSKATLEVVAQAPSGTAPRVSSVAVSTIVSALHADPGVASAAPRRAKGTTTTIDVALRTGDAHEAETVIHGIQASVDPGPLRLEYSSPALTLDAVRTSIQGQLGKLELLVAPLSVLVLLALAGLGGGLTAVLAAAISIGGALLAIRLTGGYLFAVAPAAAIGLAQAVELSALHTALLREERFPQAPPGAVPVRVLHRWLPGAAAATAVRGLGPLALLATSFEGAGSIAVACLVASVLAFATVLLAGPSLVALAAGSSTVERPETRLGRALRAAPRALAASRWRLAGVFVPAVGLALLVAAPARQAATSPLLGPAEVGGQGVLDGIGTAAVLVGLGVAAALALGRSLTARLRMCPAAAFSLLPAAGAVGVLVFAVQDGHLSGLAGTRSALYGGSLAVCLVAVASIAAGRSALAAATARSAVTGGIGPVGAAEVATGLTIPGAVASSVVVIACFGVLGAADQDVAREVGVGIAAGTLLDLALLRLPFLAFLARWGQ